MSVIKPLMATEEQNEGAQSSPPSSPAPRHTFQLSPWLCHQGREQGQLKLCTAGAGDSTAGPSAERLRHVTGLG